MTMTLTKADIQQGREERRRARRIRSQKTELLGLPACDICAGATSGSTDPEVVCVCAAERARLNARIIGLRAAHGTHVAGASDVIAP